jgi:hypothetical protein
MAWLTALAVSATVVLSAPFMGQLRAALRSAFPERFVLIVGGMVAAAIAAAVMTALFRIKTRRTARYGALAAAVGLGAGYSLAFATGTPEVDVVERVHFVEYGLITFLYYRAARRFDDVSVLVLPVLAGLLVGTFEEWFQWFIPNRVGEVRDVFLNLVAIGCGLLFSVGVDPPEPNAVAAGLTPSAARAIGVASVVVLVTFSSFVYSVHAGYQVVDEHVGAFRSRYTRETLHALARDRTERWRTRPPVALERLSREDQYMDEALWHIRRRNLAWSEGDVHRAWGENRILEKFFEPMLDTPTYAGLNGHRWPREQRADAEARASSYPSSAFVSDAEPYPILVWPHAAFWTVVAAAAATIAAWTRIASSRQPARSVLPMMKGELQ